jgi:hypothetical protein
MLRDPKVNVSASRNVAEAERGGMLFMSGPGMVQQPAARDVVGDVCWFPEDYVPSGNTISFVRTDTAAIGRQTFLDHRWNRDGRARVSLKLDAIAAELPVDAPAPRANFIWHTSFCCSTLIADALNVAGKNLSLKEPQMLVTVADAKRAGVLTDGKISPRLPELALRVLGRSPEPGVPVTIKPSNFANVLIGPAAHHSTGKSLFLYSKLPDFLISVAKSGLQLSKYARRLFFGIVSDDGKPLRWPAAELFQMSDLEVAAIAWHLQMAEFQRSWKEWGPERAALLDCDAFLANPRVTLEKLDAFFGYGFGPQTIDAIIKGPVFSRHAKLPQAPFSAEQRRMETERTRKFLGADLQRIVDWSYRAYPEAQQSAALPAALM